MRINVRPKGKSHLSIYLSILAFQLSGTAAFIEDPANPPPIYAHADTARQITQFLSTPDLSMQRVYR